MAESRDRWLFGVTLASAAAVLVSIAAAETLLAMAALGWLLVRPARIVWPTYVIPLAAFMVTTVISLMMSPQPEIGMSSVRKFVLFMMGLLAANDMRSDSVQRGIAYLLKTQRRDGSWDESLYTGTGFPRVFYLEYTMYRQYFPLLALTTYAKTTAQPEEERLRLVRKSSGR